MTTNDNNASHAESGNDRAAVLAQTQTWVEKAVIGLNLCPFAKAVQVKKQIRYTVTEATSVRELHTILSDEIQLLLEADPALIETTLLIHPHVLNDFLDFNDFLDVADELLEELDADGVLQIASFHPDYQFAGSKPDDIENYTNRSPFPTLHILREESIDRAVDSYPDTDDIFQKNMDTLNKLGLDGWKKLFVEPSAE
ncbi:DUF1415 domain-containing protein [Sapientia aquatica]|uniref:DUF1415 domain-containing protein n=1 Tax=Sapientia aquatica TaxID=1549640 RepID=A0A4R5W560_9BURK|nr:DUF1415 domain-containing protein [Sapientia aquatica]TDK68169.1 DUF1415 domain-containing protein [Sapientia aquatica]